MDQKLLTDFPPRPLFEVYPTLRERVPFTPLAALPTPLERLPRLSEAAGAAVWIKRDGRTHPIFGGNKLRKYEFIFGDVLRRGTRAVLTAGSLGSNHALATGVVARQLGLRTLCAYDDQPLTPDVQRALRRGGALGLEMCYGGNEVGLYRCYLTLTLRELFRAGRFPYFIRPGAPEPLGTLGYVNAAFEIKAQLAEQGQPDPEAIFVAVGSGGTQAGLLLGARLAGLHSAIVGVQIVPPTIANPAKIARIATETARTLNHHDPAIPRYVFTAGDVTLTDAYLGPGYGHATDAALHAITLMRDLEGRQLEITYTGKALAALLDYAAQHPGARLLFIDTLAESPALPEGDPQDLPRAFRRFFAA